MILSLAPLGEANLPLGLVTLRAALLQALDLVPFSLNKEEYARRYARLLFPFATTATTITNPLEFKAVWGAVASGGRTVFSAPAHHHCVYDHGGWDAVFPPFFGSPVDDPAAGQLETWIARRVALSASELPIAMVEMVNAPRSRGLLVLPDAERLVVDGPLRDGPLRGGAVRVDPSPEAVKARRAQLLRDRRREIKSGEDLLARERERVADKTFEDFAPEAVFHSTKAAGPGQGSDKTEMVRRSGLAVAGDGGGRAFWRGPEGSDCESGKRPAVLFFDEAVAFLSLPGYRSCFSPPTSHRAGGNGQLCLVADDCPVIAIEWCSAYTLSAGKKSDGPGEPPSEKSGSDDAVDPGSLSVSSCPLAALPCFQLIDTRVCLEESTAKKMAEGSVKRYMISGAISAAEEKEGEEGKSGGTDGDAKARVETRSVTLSGCIPCGRPTNVLQRRLLAIHVELLGRSLEDHVELAAVGDWNNCALNPWEQVGLLFDLCFFSSSSPPVANFLVQFFFPLPLCFISFFFFSSFVVPLSRARPRLYS